jgi:hypothetical protein
MNELFTRTASSITTRFPGGVRRRLVDKVNDVLSVKDFGARGDGVTDDTTSIRNAITAAAGKTLYFPAGTYIVSGPTQRGIVFQLPAQGITLQGAGCYSSVIKTTSATGAYMLAAVDAEKIEVLNLGFDGGASARVPWQRAAMFRGVLKSTFRDCWFYRVGDGVLNYGRTGFGVTDPLPNATRQPEDIIVTGCVFEDCWGTIGIVTKPVGSHRTIITHNIFNQSCTIAVSMESEFGEPTEFAEQIVVSNNVINGCSFSRASGQSVVSWGIAIAEQAQLVVVANNTIDTVNGSTVGAGITVSSSPGQTDTFARQINVTGNIIRNISVLTGYGYGVLVETGDINVEALVVSENNISECTAGIVFSTSTGTKTLGTIQDMVCSGNVVRNCSTVGIWHFNLSSSGELPIRRSNVVNNVVTGCTSHGASLAIVHGNIANNVFSGNGGLGLFVQSTANWLNIQGNTCSQNVSHGMQGASPNTTIIGNTCMDNGVTGTSTFGIFWSAGANTILSNNRCGDSGVGLQNFGIRAVAGSTIRNNELIGNTETGVWGPIASHNTGTYDAGLNRTA